MDRLLLFSPGPVMVKENVRNALLHRDICHRSREFEGLFARLQEKICKLFQADGSYCSVVVSGSGTAANETVLSSIFARPEDAVLLISNGVFGERLEEIITKYKIPLVKVDTPWAEYPDLAQVEQALKDHPEVTAVAMVFHEKFTQEYVESKMASLADYANDPYCMGIFTDNEIPWKDYALDRCLEKWPASHVNHQKAQQWLDARKGKTGATLAEATDEDRRAFIAYCFEEYLKKVTAAIDKLAPNIPYLGCRFNQWNYELKNDEMFKVAGKYMDVISINHYQKWDPDQQFCQAWTSWSGRPFVITEFYTKGEDSGLPNNTGAGWNVPTQQDRGYFYQNFVNGLLKSGNCVGWHWFTYMDNDPENMNTDPSNRDSNKGMVTWNFEPYIPLQDNMKQMNENVYWLARFYDGNPAGEN